jgi:hypothetical protein
VDGSRQSPGFASQDSFLLSNEYNQPSQDDPVTDCEFPRIQLRGSAGFSPASLLTFVGEDARTKEVEKERNPLSPNQRKEWVEV